MDNRSPTDQMLSRRVFVRGLGVVGAGLWIVGCGDDDGQAGTTTDTTTGDATTGDATTGSPSPAEFAGASLSTIMTPGLVQGPWFVADHLGFFDDEGLDFKVEVQNVGSSERVRLLSGGNIELSTTTPSASTNNALERGAPLLGVANGPILSEECPDGVWLVSDEAWQDGVRTVADLEGRKVALFHGFDGLAGRTLVLLAREAGLDPFSAFEVSDWTSFGDMAAALSSGQIDAMISQEPATSSLKAEANAHELAYVYEVLPDEPGFVIFMHKGWVEENPEGTVRVMKGYLRGIHRFNEARDGGFEDQDVVDALVQATELDPELIKSVTAPCFPDDGRVDLEKIDAALQYGKAMGTIDDIIPPEDFIDLSYVEEAYSRLKADGMV